MFKRNAVLKAGLFAVLGITFIGTVWASDTEVGTLKVETHGNQGRPVILIPGLDGGSWVWQQTVAQMQGSHRVYVVTLAGFNGTPPPASSAHLLDQADASLLQLIQREHIVKPVLVGHSMGGTLALRFAGEHAGLLSGVVAVDGLPIFPGMERITAQQRQAFVAAMQQKMANETQEQFKTESLAYMQHIGVLDSAMAARYAPLNERSDIKATAAYVAEDLTADYRDLLKQAHVPILEISPYNAADFSKPPMQMSEQQKTDYYRSLLANAPDATVISISPSRHYVMLDQPEKFQQALASFLAAH